MEVEELKQLIDVYHVAGKSRDEVVAVVSAIPINGESSVAFEYIDLKYEPTSDKNLIEFNLTDSGNADYFCCQYGDTLRYDHARQRWLLWDKHRWKPEADGYVMRLALKSVRDRYKAAINIDDLELREKTAKWTISSEQRARLEACIALAKNLKPIADAGEQWDINGWFFCVTNGVIELKTGEMRPGKPEDMITMQSPTAVDTAAVCPLWDKFINQVTGGDVELQNYLQCAVGYSLTSETKAQLWYFLYGLGSNGKTTFTMVLRRLMGDYGVRLDSDDLMVKDKKARGSNPKEGLADTRGKRYAVASEVQDGKRLDIGLLKDMSGQDTIKARRLYEHEIEFLPTHKLWMFGNHKPAITDTTHAAWRRLKLIPFTYTVPDSDLDPDLQTKLHNELPGILNWAVKGCLRWQKEGLTEPIVVTNAVAAYRHDSDILADFIEDCCMLEPLTTTLKTDLKTIYEQWCKDSGLEPITQRTFKTRLVEKGMGEGRVGKGRFWTGIRLKTEDEKQAISDKTSGDIEAKVTRDSGVGKSLHMEGENETLCTKTPSLVTLVTDDTENMAPEFPTKACPSCGSTDYWLSDDNRWLCLKCHPKPKKKNERKRKLGNDDKVN